MSAIKSRIQTDRMAAMRARDAGRKGTLDYILGQIQKAEKDPGGAAKESDGLAMAIIAAYLKSLRENIATVGEAKPDAAAGWRAEIEMLSAYMPAMLTDDELAADIRALTAAGVTGKGPLMKALKEKHGTALDGQRASVLVGQTLPR